MPTTPRYVTPLFIAAGAAAAIFAAPAASAEPAPAPEPTPAPTAEAAAPGLLPKCVNEGGAEALGGSSTECATPGNVQINDTPAEEPYVGPWGDMFGGDGFFFP